MERKKMAWQPIVLYVLAIIFCLYTVYSLVATTQYVGQMLGSGYITMSDSFADILSYYMTNVGVYLFYTGVLGAVAYGIDILQRGMKAPKAETTKTKAPVKAIEEATVTEAIEAPDEVTEEAEIEKVETEEAETEEAKTEVTE